MIARHWKGIARTELADAYLEHLERDTLPALRKIDGFRGATILRRPIESGIEYIVITRWESMESINRFAGPDTDKAVVPSIVHGMLAGFDQQAAHYEVALEIRNDHQTG